MHPGQALPQGGAFGGALEQEADPVQAILDRPDGEERAQHPVAQQASPHGGAGAIQDREERPFAPAVARVLGHLERPPGRLVEDHGVPRLAPGDAGDVLQVRLVGLLQAVQQRPGGADRQVTLLDAEAGEAGDSQRFGQGAGRRAGGQGPARDRMSQDAGEALLRQEAVERHPLGVENLARPEQGDLGGQGLGSLGAVMLRQAEIAGREIEIGAAVRSAARPAAAVDLEGGDVVGLRRPELRGVGHGAGGDDAGHGPLHDPLRGARVLDLVADRHPVALLDEPRHVAVGGMVRHAAHRRLVRRAAPAGRQGEGQGPRRHEGVVVEHLVEIAQAEHQDGVRVLGLDGPVLAQHRGDRVHGPPL